MMMMMMMMMGRRKSRRNTNGVMLQQAGKGDDGWELPVMSAESDRDIHRTSKTKHEHSENHHHPHIHHQGKISNLKQNIQCEGSHQVACHCNSDHSSIF
eukprot:767668-Hanusia_phi.AAC.8